jgi:hypothetical protein
MGNDMRKLIDQVKTLVNTLNEESKGLWANIQAKKERGEEPAKKVIRIIQIKNNGII